VAPPLTAGGLTCRRDAEGTHAWHEPIHDDEGKEATMTIKRVALVLLCLMSGTAVAEEPKVTSLMSKDLAENPGRKFW
jgi:hypothetical protein